MDIIVDKILGKIKNIEMQQRIAFVASLLAGFLAHGYALANNYIYHDATILNGLGTTFGLGRWALGYVGHINDLIFGNYHLPFLNIVISLIFIALSAMVVVDVLDVSSKFMSAFIGAIFSVYPVVTSTFAYNFSATYYFFALLLAVLAVKIITDVTETENNPKTLKNDKIKSRLYIKSLVQAVLLLALSAGFYQAYLSVAVTLALTVIMIELVVPGENRELASTIRKGITYVVVFIVSLVVYLIVNKISFIVMKPPATGYQGAEDMGSLSLAKIPGRFIQTYLHFFYIKWNGINKATCMWVFIIAFVVVAAACIVVFLVKNKQPKANIILFIVALALMPLAVNLVYVMSTNDSYSVHTLMRFATVFVLITPAILIEKMYNVAEIKGDTLATTFKLPMIVEVTLLAVITFCYIYLNNMAYIKMNLVQEEMTSYFTVLEARICSTEGYNDETPIVFSGEFNISDNYLTDINDVYDDVVILGYEYKAGDLINKESWKNYMKYHAGFAPNIIEAPESLYSSEEFANLQVYPDADSIKMIDGVIVVKLSQ